MLTFASQSVPKTDDSKIQMGEHALGVPVPSLRADISSQTVHKVTESTSVSAPQARSQNSDLS